MVEQKQNKYSIEIDNEWKEKHKDEITKSKKIDILFKNVKSKNVILKVLGKKVRELAMFKQPVVILGRNNGHWEMHENCKMGWFIFDHSNGTQRAIYLDGRPDYMDYGENSFKIYMLHEDIGIKLPQRAILTSEFILDMQQKMDSDRLHLEKEFDIKKRKQMVELIKIIFYGMIGLLVVLGLIYMVNGDLSFLMFWKTNNQVVQNVVNVTTTTMPNFILP